MSYDPALHCPCTCHSVDRPVPDAAQCCIPHCDGYNVRIVKQTHFAKQASKTKVLLDATIRGLTRRPNRASDVGMTDTETTTPEPAEPGLLDPPDIHVAKAINQLALDFDTNDSYDTDEQRVFSLLVTVFRHYVDISGTSPNESPIQREHTAYSALEALAENLGLELDWN